MTQDATRFIGSIPEHYDRDLVPHIFSGFADDLATRVAAHHPTAVLELAAGSGVVTRALRSALSPDCVLLASDLNEAMMTVARKRFEQAEKVEFRQIDANDLPLDDQSFDAVTCQFGVMFFPDKDRSFREVHRVLRPGGRYVFNVWGRLGRECVCPNSA